MAQAERRRIGFRGRRPKGPHININDVGVIDSGQGSNGIRSFNPPDACVPPPELLQFFTFLLGQPKGRHTFASSRGARPLASALRISDEAQLFGGVMTTRFSWAVVMSCVAHQWTEQAAMVGCKTPCDQHRQDRL